MDDERIHILQMIEDGQISASEGLRMIEALRPAATAEAAENAAPMAGPESSADAAGARSPASWPGSPPVSPGQARWQNWWRIPMWLGIALATLGSLLMYWAYTARFSFSGWFWLALLFVFAPGVTLMALAASSRKSKWLHLRIKNRQGRENVALSFPVPIQPVAWGLRTFGRWLPALEKTGVDELIMALGETTSPDNPLYVEVDDDEEGEKVQVYIG